MLSDFSQRMWSKRMKKASSGENVAIFKIQVYLKNLTGLGLVFHISKYRMGIF